MFYLWFLDPLRTHHVLEARGNRLSEDKLYLKHRWRNYKYATFPLRKKMSEFDFIWESVLSLWEWQRWPKRFFSTSSVLTVEPTVVTDWDIFSCLCIFVFAYMCVCVFVHLCIYVFVFWELTKIDISQRRFWLALFVRTKEREHWQQQQIQHYYQ